MAGRKFQIGNVSLYILKKDYSYLSHSMDSNFFYESFSSRQKPKVMYIGNSLESGQSFQDLSWNHRTSTPHRSETTGNAKRAARTVKRRNLRCTLCNRAWMKNGWLVPWNGVANCAMPTTSWQIGNFFTKKTIQNTCFKAQ